MMKIVTYNVNGIRSAMSKNLCGWITDNKPDIICFQEIKAQSDQIETHLFDVMGYQHYWFSAQKKGYSGVAILSKATPLHVEYGCGNAEYDAEGRVIRADFLDFSVLNIYFPSGSSGDIRQDVKYKFLDFIYEYILTLRKTIPNLIVVGDYNIAHTEIDIHNPKSNKDSSGFLPEERAWMSKFFESGMHDSYRYKNAKEQKYTWWSFRFNARAKNLGWRIDYIAVAENILPRIDEVNILNDAIHSDHCPVEMILHT